MESIYMNFMKKWKKLIFTLFAVAAIIAVSIVGYEEYQGYKEDALKREYAVKILDHFGITAEEDFHKNIDRVREIVNRYSAHKIDDWFRSYWRNDIQVMKYFYESSVKGGRIVHAECSVRSSIMVELFRVLGYNARHVSVYAAANNSHTFLEVLNPLTKKWEAQDPDYDLYWRDRQSQKRLSAEEVISIKGDLKTLIEPCGQKKCGWDVRSREGNNPNVLESFFGLLVRGYRKKQLFLNKQRYKCDLKSYCEQIPKNCKNKTSLGEGGGKLYTFPKVSPL